MKLRVYREALGGYRQAPLRIVAAAGHDRALVAARRQDAGAGWGLARFREHRGDSVPHKAEQTLVGLLFTYWYTLALLCDIPLRPPRRDILFFVPAHHHRRFLSFGLVLFCEVLEGVGSAAHIATAYARRLGLRARGLPPSERVVLFAVSPCVAAASAARVTLRPRVVLGSVLNPRPSTSTTARGGQIVTADGEHPGSLRLRPGLRRQAGGSSSRG